MTSCIKFLWESYHGVVKTGQIESNLNGYKLSQTISLYLNVFYFA